MTGPQEASATVASRRGLADSPRPRPVWLGRLLDIVPLGLAIVAEAAWLAVLAGLVAEYTLQEPHLAIGVLALFVLAGVLSARFLAERAGDRWPTVALLLVAVAGLIGWLSSPVAATRLGESGVFAALGLNVAGWVAALALLRGFAHANLPVSATTLATLFGVGVPCLAAAALAGGMITEPHRTRFLADATVAVVIFAGTSILALAIARLAAVGAGAGFDWRRNPAWVVLLVVLVVTTLAVAVPASGASPLIALIAGTAVGPALVIGLIVGFNRSAVRTIAFAVLAAVLIVAAIRFFASGGLFEIRLSLDGTTGGQPVATEPGPASQVGLAVVVVLATILVLVLARLWMRRGPPEAVDVVEVRRIDQGPGETARPRRSALRRVRPMADPRDAVEAYVRLLADLDGRIGIRREPTETPAAHAARLRAAGTTDLSLDLLAADYALARFGGVGLSGPEDRRAVDRWRRLRRSLGAAPTRTR